MARRMSSCDDALPSPLPLIHVLVTCVPNRNNKRKTGFSTVRKHIIRHRAIFEVSLRNSTANFRKTAVCSGSPARISENFKTDRKIFDFLLIMHFIWFRTVDFARPFDLMFEQIPSLTQSYCPGEPVAVCWIQLEPNSAWRLATHRYRLATEPVLDLNKQSKLYLKIISLCTSSWLNLFWPHCL